MRGRNLIVLTMPKGKAKKMPKTGRKLGGFSGRKKEKETGGRGQLTG